jgi:hypothetical protein
MGHLGIADGWLAGPLKCLSVPEVANSTAHANPGPSDRSFDFEVFAHGVRQAHLHVAHTRLGDDQIVRPQVNGPERPRGHEHQQPNRARFEHGRIVSEPDQTCRLPSVKKGLLTRTAPKPEAAPRRAD